MLQFGMPTLIENRTLQENVALCSALNRMSPGTVLGDNLSYPNAKKLSMRTVPTDMYRARGQNRGILLL